MTKDEFNGWKSSIVTKEVFRTIHERIYELEQGLGYSAGLDARNDVLAVGAIQAYKDILNIDFEETQS